MRAGIKTFDIKETTSQQTNLNSEIIFFFHKKLLFVLIQLWKLSIVNKNANVTVNQKRVWRCFKISKFRIGYFEKNLMREIMEIIESPKFKSDLKMLWTPFIARQDAHFLSHYSVGGCQEKAFSSIFYVTLLFMRSSLLDTFGS